MTCGPSLPSSMSTPATRSPMIWADRTAASSKAGSSWTASTEPPRWTLERNSSPCATRRIAATTRSPTTRARMSRPLLSLTKRWISTFCLVLWRVSMIASATLRSGARITPMPCVPSSSLITTGAPPTRSIAGITSARSRTNVVGGITTSWRERICEARSLSRELLMPAAVLGV